MNVDTTVDKSRLTLFYIYTLALYSKHTNVFDIQTKTTYKTKTTFKNMATDTHSYCYRGPPKIFAKGKI
jgi:hypothetical protein